MGCGISLGKKTVHPDEHENTGESNGDVGHAKDKGATKDNSTQRKGRRDSGLVKNSNNPLNNTGRPIVSMNTITEGDDVQEERTQSQVEFFKMLDAKIEEGADYLSEEED